nr:integrase, catalytic region, zinc finger, CCHC-type, peptidase aspartic, catalytic [Tanacetum cinerariifolium]
MSRDVITVGSTMRILLLYRGEYSQWRERFMNYLEEQTDGEAMINSIQNGDQPFNETGKDLWDALERQMRGSEYGEQDRKAAILYEYETFKANEGEQQTKNLVDINIDALYNILKQNQGDVNDALGYKKKAVVITSDQLALVAEKTNVSKRKEKVVVSSDSEGSGVDDFNELKKITALLAKAFNRRKFYSKPTNNNLRTSSTSQSANKKQESVKSDDKKEDKKADEKKRDMSKVKCYNCKKKGHFAKDYKKAKDQAWMESSSDSNQEINANMVFMAQIEKVLSESDESSSSAEETIAEMRKDVVSEEMHRLLKRKKIIIDLEDGVVSLLEKEKENLKTIESLKSKGSESSENEISESENQSENDYLVVEKECDKVENPKICLWIINSGWSKHMTGNRALLTNFVEKFLEMVRFGNNDFAVIAGYGDVVIGSMTTKKVYYVEGLGHNLFSVGQFCDKGLEVAFRKSTCFVRNEDGVDLLTGDHSSNLYTIALNEVATNSSTCLLAKASSLQSWLWHQHFSHLNFATINNLVKNNLVQVQRVQTDNGTEFKNKTLAKFFDEVGITQQFSAARTPQQNGVVERRNRTLVKAARTMLTFANLPSFLWAEAITTACFTQNSLVIHKHFDKTPYELINKIKPNIKFFRMFGCRCYLLKDYEDVGKLKEKGDIRVFVGYSKKSTAFRIYNKRTRKIHESVNVNFDEISEMASKQFSLEPGLYNLNET